MFLLTCKKIMAIWALKLFAIIQSFKVTGVRT